MRDQELTQLQERIRELAFEQIQDMTLEIFQLRAMLEHERTGEASEWKKRAKHGEMVLKETYESMDKWEQRALTAEQELEELREDGDILASVIGNMQVELEEGRDALLAAQAAIAVYEQEGEL